MVVYIKIMIYLPCASKVAVSHTNIRAVWFNNKRFRLWLISYEHSWRRWISTSKSLSKSLFWIYSTVRLGRSSVKDNDVVHIRNAIPILAYSDDSLYHKNNIQIEIIYNFRLTSRVKDFEYFISVFRAYHQKTGN